MIEPDRSLHVALSLILALGLGSPDFASCPSSHRACSQASSRSIKKCCCAGKAAGVRCTMACCRQQPSDERTSLPASADSSQVPAAKALLAIAPAVQPAGGFAVTADGWTLGPATGPTIPTLRSLHVCLQV